MSLFKAVELEPSILGSTYVRLRLDDAYALNPNVLGLVRSLPADVSKHFALAAPLQNYGYPNPNHSTSASELKVSLQNDSGKYRAR